MKYIIGTRKSKLAMAQAHFVCEKLKQSYPEDKFAIQIVETKGDLILDRPLHEIGDKGLFVKEIEERILSREIDIGVHSMKDMPALPAPGLRFAKTWKREDPRDVLILREKKSLEELAPGSVIGTGSKRREFQLKRLRPDLNVINIRGNVDTRLRKMRENKLDGIVLAAAGLHRLGMQDQITMYFEEKDMISAPAQGALALEIREGEEKLLGMLDAFADEETANQIEAERGFLQEIGGDCHIPVGAACKKTENDTYELRAMFGNEAGTKQAYAFVQGIHQWNKNNHSPRLTVDALVVTKRMDVSHRRHVNAGDHTGAHRYHTTTSTFYYVTFQVDSGDRMELTVGGADYGQLVEGDRGKLTFQGTRYLGFQRF